MVAVVLVSTLPACRASLEPVLVDMVPVAPTKDGAEVLRLTAPVSAVSITGT